MAYAINPDSLPASSALVSAQEFLSNISQYPLLSITHLKFSGLLTLAFGLHAHREITLAVADRIKTTLEALQQAEFSSDHRALFPSSMRREAKFAFLDPVASDDLIILSQCSNFSLAATVISAIRNLTFSVLWGNNDPQEYFAKISDTHIFAKNECCGMDFLKVFTGEMNGRLAAQQISSNHLISSSYTTLAVSGDISALEEQSVSVDGLVAVRTVANVNPGHEIDVSDWLSEELEKLDAHRVEPNRNWRFVVPGRHDLDTCSVRAESFSCVRTGEASDGRQ